MVGRRPRVIVVGGGFGGLNTVKALRRADADVILLDRRNHHLFQPLLYQVATAALSPANIAAPLRRVVQRQENCHTFLGEVRAVDLANRRIRFGPTEQAYSYDYLVLAPGAQTNYFGNDHWSEVAPGLKTIEEALDIRSRFLLAFEQAEYEADPDARQAALTFAIVGGGPTGVELAGAMAEIANTTLRASYRHFDTSRARVMIIDAGPRLLSTFHEELSARTLRDLHALGVEVILNAHVVNVEPGAFTIRSDSGDTRIAAANIFWAAGVRGAKLLTTLGVPLTRGGQVAVGPDLSLPDFPEVFVIGDAASAKDSPSGRPVPGVAQGAMQMGRFVGSLIAREIEAEANHRPRPARPAFHYRDKGSMATIGRSRAVAEVGDRRFDGMIAWLLWAVVHVYFLIGYRNRIMTMLEWVWMYFFYERGARLITGEHLTPAVKRLPPDDVQI